MSSREKTLGEWLSDPRIAFIAPDAIRGRDLSEEDVWHMTLSQIREAHLFSGNIESGLRRLYAAADSGEWYYPLYSRDETAAEPARTGVNLVWFPSSEPAADSRPFILVVPGGGFVNVWNLTEGWPITESFNRLGYHCFILTYQVEAEEGLLLRNMEDMARALEMIRAHADRFHVDPDHYMTCGFSAGGYLVCLWNTRMGYPAHHLPVPAAVFPVYPVTTLQPAVRYGSPDLETSVRLYGCSAEEAARQDFEIPEHVDGFPPCALFLAAEDTLVDPENSRMLARALREKQIPCFMEIGPSGGHGFGDGTGMCMAGWTARAVQWYASLKM